MLQPHQSACQGLTSAVSGSVGNKCVGVHGDVALWWRLAVLGELGGGEALDPSSRHPSLATPGHCHLQLQTLVSTFLLSSLFAHSSPQGPMKTGAPNISISNPYQWSSLLKRGATSPIRNGSGLFSARLRSAAHTDPSKRDFIDSHNGPNNRATEWSWGWRLWAQQALGVLGVLSPSSASSFRLSSLPAR